MDRNEFTSYRGDSLLSILITMYYRVIKRMLMVSISMHACMWGGASLGSIVEVSLIFLSPILSHSS